MKVSHSMCGPHEYNDIQQFLTE